MASSLAQKVYIDWKMATAYHQSKHGLDADRLSKRAMTSIMPN